MLRRGLLRKWLLLRWWLRVCCILRERLWPRPGVLCSSLLQTNALVVFSGPLNRPYHSTNSRKVAAELVKGESAASVICNSAQPSAMPTHQVPLTLSVGIVRARSPRAAASA